ncbi:hypothetical protein GLOTRDRAFT_111221 [Gloeophyllum trabeum ATCC 11539]|uniref:Uncharacterized protein n=1 Tax=Gloeophyllum trabeum (strain ATCC 11539 / FP-39264 / Madison 617) TaxID=670483 RepID=S7RR18_GLOTA|nr:uncharacterized protein GLOTRDRAFT_111221 [Gloeophyllum trabeum ATCC 11539]EPQ55364.1 hypothetical protein GLOTRDRAFT_111221 [Gloeophyllum trabeum ATCC 11539]
MSFDQVWRGRYHTNSVRIAPPWIKQPESCKSMLHIMSYSPPTHIQSNNLSKNKYTQHK